MPLLLIGVRQNRWLKQAAQPWLDRGDVPADPVVDLRVSENQLSVWEVLPDKSNLKRVVRALAIGKDEIQPNGWVLFDSGLLAAAGIKPPVQKAGTTRDEGANPWHRDLVDLSGLTLVALTKTILTNGESGQLLKKELVGLVSAGIDANELREDQLPEKIRKQVEQHRAIAAPAKSRS